MAGAGEPSLPGALGRPLRQGSVCRNPFGCISSLYVYLYTIFWGAHVGLALVNVNINLIGTTGTNRKRFSYCSGLVSQASASIDPLAPCVCVDRGREFGDNAKLSMFCSI